MDFGRDFAFYAALLPLLAATFVDARIQRVTLLTLAIGALVSDLAEIASVVSHHTLTLLVHAERTTEENGITRIYVHAQYLTVVAAMLGVGLWLLARERKLRLFGVALALFSISSIALELTRAQYVGGTVGLIFALAVWVVFGQHSAHFGRQRVARFVFIIIIFGGIVTLVYPPQISNTAIGGVEERFSSVFTELSSNNTTRSTVAYRKVEAAELEQVLGSKWVFGLGFLDPRSHYVIGVREGSIRNGDVGVLNVVMTMGIVGALLIYFPLVYMLFGLVRAAIAGAELPGESWIAFGIAAWIVSTLTSSLTLVTLFSPSGLCITAVALAVGANVLDRTSLRRREGLRMA